MGEFMKLFGKKTRHSSLRFCKHAVELPLLFDMPVITVAISRLAQSRHFPAKARQRDGGTAYGLLHSWGFERPVLPVEIEFSDYVPDERNRIAWGWATTIDANEEPHYILQVHVSDPDRAIFDAVQEAMMRAALSNYQYFHVEFRHDYLNRRGTREKMPDYTKKGQEREAMLRAVDNGDAKLPDLTFDEIAFADAVTTRAPMWSWDFWNVVGQNSSIYQSAAVARYRKAMKWPPLPES